LVDRDGVINKNIDGDYVRSWEQFVFLPGSLEAVAALTEKSYTVAVITNQSCINKGLVSRKTVEEINRRMSESVTAAGGRISRIYVCPHTREENCTCRKPGSGMLEQAAREMGFSPADAWLIGDAADDIAAGKKFGCRTILVLSGRTSGDNAEAVQADRVCQDLAGAVKIILAKEKQS